MTNEEENLSISRMIQYQEMANELKITFFGQEGAIIKLVNEYRNWLNGHGKNCHHVPCSSATVLQRFHFYPCSL